MKDLATLLAYIKDKYPFAIIKVTDYLIEQVNLLIYLYFIIYLKIMSGMEINNFNERQKRITIIKLFGELYCYEIIDTGLLKYNIF